MERFEIRTRLYANKRLAIELIEDGEPWGVLTTNLINAQLADDEICIPKWNLPGDIMASFLKSGKFEDTGKTEPAGFENAPVWRVLCPDILASAARQRDSVG